MKKELLVMASFFFIFLILGCSGQTKNEAVLTQAQGLGVTSFRPAVTQIGMGGYNYVLLVLRNNAEGFGAQDIYVSLENVEPFKIQECGELHTPSEARGVICESFFNDLGQPYKTHFIESMFPDEEIQFFWNIKAPEKDELANMYYNHPLYYSILYSYKVSSTQNVLAMSQQQYFEETEKGTTISPLGSISSAGEISITSRTQQPIIYTQGDQPTEFLLTMDIANTGEGVPNPNKKIAIVIDYPSDPTLETSSDLYSQYGWDVFSESDYAGGKEFSDITISERGLVKEIEPSSLFEPLTINLPFQLIGGNIYEPEKTLTFNIHIAYSYLKEGMTTLEVYPIKG